MEVIEKSVEGLKREFEVKIPQDNLVKERDNKVKELKGKVQLKGFRPGKVPASHIIRTYGEGIMRDLLEEIIGKTNDELIKERDEKLAFQPRVKLVGEEDENTIKAILKCEGDLSYTISYEIVPPFDVADLKTIKIERPVYEPDEAEIEERLENLAQNMQNFDDAPEGSSAENTNRVNIDFIGRKDGEAFEGGTAQGQDLVLGSGRFIPGFEENLEGMKVGESKTFPVTFPEDYPQENLAGQEVEFEVKLNAISIAAKTELDDEFAKSLGKENIQEIKDLLKEMAQNEYAQQSRAKAKRALLDAMNEAHSFELPPSLVEEEFNGIWEQMTQEMEQNGESFEDSDKNEEDTRKEFQYIAERRVKLGLVLSHIGEENNITVNDDEVMQVIQGQMRQFPGREQELISFYRENPSALMRVKAPIFEDKVINYILEIANVEDKVVSKEELMKEDDEA